MKPLPPPIHAPLSVPELNALQALATAREPFVVEVTPETKTLHAKAAQALRQRGFVQKVDESYVVTPEGLAAFLDVVGVDGQNLP
jgi:hypothetical protein